MAYTQDDIDRLKAAMAKGARSLEIGGEKVVFASFSEMRRQLQDMVAEVAGVASGGVVVIYPKTGRGL